MSGRGGSRWSAEPGGRDSAAQPFEQYLEARRPDIQWPPERRARILPTPGTRPDVRSSGSHGECVLESLLSGMTPKLKEPRLFQRSISLWMAGENHNLKVVSTLLQQGKHTSVPARIRGIEHIIQHDELTFVLG